MDEALAISFPCKVFPEEPRVQRLLGIYPMRQEGLFMLRVRTPSGQVTLPQWRRLAELAREFTPEYPLHLTTRQDVELHGLRPEQIVPAQEALHVVGLTSARTGGDSVRNVVCCPGSGMCPTGMDVLPLGAAILSACEAQPHVHALPRKFKVSLSACERSCGRPWIQDLGLVCRNDQRFQAVVGGSLGPRPATGIEYPRTLALEEVVPFVLGAMRLFNEEGDRKARGRARLRHVRERLGDAVFLARLEGAFLEEVRSGRAPVPPQPFPPEGRTLRACLRPPLGDFAPEAALAMAQVAGAVGGTLRIGLDHDLLLYGYRPCPLPESLAALIEGPAVVSCPGTAWCSRGIADSRTVGLRIGERLKGRADFQVRISGCPNHCAQSAVADIGLAGCVKTIRDARTECFRLFAGGGLGVNGQLAHELHPALPADRAPEAVSWLIDEYRKTNLPSREDFSAFILREKERLVSALAAKEW